MLFPVSGVEVAPWVPPLVAFVISFFTSMGGVSGGFLILPFMVSVLGFTGPSVSPTNLVFNVVAIPSGILRYLEEGRMVWPVTWMVVLGSLPGVIIGAVIRIRFLPDPRHFKLFVGLVLLYIALRLAGDTKAWLMRALKKHPGLPHPHLSGLHPHLVPDGAGAVQTLEWTHRRIVFTFHGQTYTLSTHYLFLMAMVVGVIGGTYGIAGGAIIAPLLVVAFGAPIYTVAGATLAGTFITSVFGIVVYHFLAPIFERPDLTITPDWLLGFFFGVGGLAGIYAGAICQKFIPPAWIKTMLLVVILGVSLQYIAQFFLR